MGDTRMVTLRIVIVTILVFAATLKALSGTSDAASPLTGPLHYVTVLAETALAVWLLSGVRAVACFHATISTLAIFCVFSGYKALVGADSCGCFGVLVVHPAITFAIDLTLLVLVLSMRDSWISGPRRSRSRIIRVASASALTLGAGAGWIVHQGFVHSVESAAGYGVKQIELLDVRGWVGQPLPVVDHINVKDELTRGRHVIVFYRSGCGTCKRLFEQLRGMTGTTPLTLISIPPHDVEYVPLASTAATRGQLASDRFWMIKAPAIALIENGRVMKAASGLDAVSFAAHDLSSRP